jgi:hypothetical protein
MVRAATVSLALLTPAHTSKMTCALNSGVKLRWVAMLVFPPLEQSLRFPVGFLCVQDSGSTTNAGEPENCTLKQGQGRVLHRLSNVRLLRLGTHVDINWPL